jgi:hypothetical protein
VAGAAGDGWVDGPDAGASFAGAGFGADSLLVLPPLILPFTHSELLVMSRPAPATALQALNSPAKIRIKISFISPSFV